MSKGKEKKHPKKWKENQECYVAEAKVKVLQDNEVFPVLIPAENVHVVSTEYSKRC